jgi:Family of unknown function (DUF6519)
VGSDRARISYDKTREYRSVVAQQGRVTLEADVNEEAVIASEALRYETIDIVGPTGTPDNGYLVSVDANGNLTVGPGIMYVGGWRMRFTQPVPVANQPEWIDQPPFVEAQNKQSLFIIALLVSEQEVQAVEDQALREVALGGPDTAARTRLMQHIVAVPTNDNTCAAVAKDWDRILKPLGLALQPDTLALDFDAALQVSFYPPAGPVDPCCPPAQGGYLGADNQLVRVTVTSYDPTTHTGTLLWGWNNASFLYRATLVDATANPQILTLSPAPVDSEHTPQINQVIEVLRSTMVLGNPADLNFIAAPEGDVITLASAGSIFDPTTNQLTLPTGPMLTGAYTTDTNPLFVRLWQAEVPFTDGTPAQLDTVSGLAVTIHMTALPTGPLEARPFWDFAVRPNTPQQVYPQRYLEGPQGPTGPRRWLTDLAIVQATGGNPATGLPAGFTIVADCRIPLNPITGLTGEGGCCGITLNPAEVAARGGLQAVVDAQAKIGQSLSLRPGSYVLESPLALTKAHAGFVLSGCSPGGRARLSVDTAAVANFSTGMITITGTSNITIQGLGFAMPVVPDTNLVSPIGAAGAFTADLTVGIGIDNSPSIVIEGCSFVFPTPASSANNTLVYIGAGIYAADNCSGLRVMGNGFQCASGGSLTTNAYSFLIGLLMSPSTLGIQATSGSTGTQNPDLPKTKTKGQAKTTAPVQAATSLVYLPNVNDLLDDVEITDNRFTGLTMAVLAFAELGMIRCDENRVANCCGGFWFLESDLGGNVAFGQAALAAESQPPQGANVAAAAAVRQFMQPVLLANAVNFSAAMRQATSSSSKNPPSAATLSNESRTVLIADAATRGQAAYTSFAASQASDPATGTTPTASSTNQQTPSDARSKKKAKSSPATASAQPADTLTDEDSANVHAAYGVLENVGIAKEAAGSTLIPALYIRGNDVELVPYDTTVANPIALQGIRCMAALTSPVDTEIDTQAPTVFLSGNRVEVPNGYSMAATVEWSSPVITGNFFNQLGVRFQSSQACVIVTTPERGLVAITGNIVNAMWTVTPPRSSIPATTDWAFLNTVF